jgi:transposase
MSGLIGYPARIWLAVEPVDLRRGIDGLSSIVQQALGHSPGAGSAFVFRNRAGNRLKLLLWDGNGVWLCFIGAVLRGRRRMMPVFRWIRRNGSG